MALMHVVTKERPRTKGSPPSHKWKIAFFISLFVNVILLSTLAHYVMVK